MDETLFEFYGVYLLYNVNPKFKGKNYIGFTVDPNRRISQHNRGQVAGGAKRTSGKGPWDMVMIIHGFPNEIAGLRFEWAWQNPQKSRCLRKVVATKTKKETLFDYNIRVLCNMLNLMPWCRMPLVIRWLNQEYKRDFEPDMMPPSHMPIAYGPLSVCTKKQKDFSASDDQKQLQIILNDNERDNFVCHLCKQKSNYLGFGLACYHCLVTFHVICLANLFLKKEFENAFIPIEGNCPNCCQYLLWGEIVRNKRVCINSLRKES